MTTTDSQAKRKGVQVFKKNDSRSWTCTTTPTGMLLVQGNKRDFHKFQVESVKRITVKPRYTPFHFFQEELNGKTIFNTVTSDECGNLTFNKYLVGPVGVKNTMYSTVLPTSQNLDWWTNHGPRTVTEERLVTDADRTYTVRVKVDGVYVDEVRLSKRFKGADTVFIDHGFPAPSDELAKTYQTIQNMGNLALFKGSVEEWLSS
jgi:hypothetical protein